VKLLFVVVIFAIVTYVAIRIMQDGAPGGPTVPRRPSRPKPPPSRRPVAPDDDEAFLRDLDFKRRREQRRPDQPPDQPG